MVWSKQQDENGISQGHLSIQEATTDKFGLWLIGDEEGMKGTPQFTSKLRLKLWCATLEKYSASNPHCPPLPAHGGRTEDVLCFTSEFFCRARGQERSLGYPNPIIGLRPDEERAWYLPEEYEFPPETARPAYGVTICRYMPFGQSPLQFGAGLEYVVRLFDRRHQSEYFPEPLHPVDYNHWNYCLWLSWRGVTRFHVNGTDYWQPPHSFTYIPRQVVEGENLEMHAECDDVAGISIHY